MMDAGDGRVAVGGVPQCVWPVVCYAWQSAAASKLAGAAKVAERSQPHGGGDLSAVCRLPAPCLRLATEPLRQAKGGRREYDACGGWL
jgi:hypothetical protein